MAGFNAFHISTLGMMAQSDNLGVIGQNIANATTTGYKRQEARFSTVLSHSVAVGNEFRRTRDTGGVRSHAINTIDGQGILHQTDRTNDLGIAGDGFFILNSLVDGDGETYYGRDGSFILAAGDRLAVAAPRDPTTTIDITTAYLADKNGYFVLGYPVGPSGVADTAGAPSPIRLDQFAFREDGVETTTVNLDLNLKASSDVGDNFKYQASIVDSAFNSKTVNLLFTNAPGDNTWYVTAGADNATTVSLGPATAYANNTGSRTTVFDAANGSIKVTEDYFNGLQTGDTFTVAGSTGNDGTYTVSRVSDDGSTIFLDAPGFVDETAAADIAFGGTITAPMVFTNSGTLSTPTSYDLSIAWGDGATSTVAIDVADFTQYAGDFLVQNNNTDGYEATEMESYRFDTKGRVIGVFGNGEARPIYQIPLANFSNPNALETHNGNVYRETTDSGEPRTSVATQTDAYSFLPNAVELSNVDLGDEMTRMIVAQNVYNSNAMAFKTVDEMIEGARDLKR